MHEFNAKFWTQIPNPLLNLVQTEKLKPRDVFTYAYLKSVVGPKAYTLRPLRDMAADLNESQSALKESLSRLGKAGVIRRKKTIRNSQTFLCLRVKTRNERVQEEMERRGILVSRTAEKSALAEVVSRPPQRSLFEPPSKVRLN